MSPSAYPAPANTPRSASIARWVRGSLLTQRTVQRVTDEPHWAGAPVVVPNATIAGLRRGGVRSMRVRAVLGIVGIVGGTLVVVGAASVRPAHAVGERHVDFNHDGYDDLVVPA